MRIKYNRTSTINQQGERFNLDTDNYDLTIFDKGVSGKIPFNQREGGRKLLKLVDENKVKEIVFEDLSRCGRTIKDCIITLSYLVDEKEINVVLKDLEIQSFINGKKNIIWNMITSLLSCLNEMNRTRILEITEMGRKMYVLNGGKLGRKVGSNENIQTFLNKPKSKQIISLLDKGKSVRDIIGRLSVSPKTIVKVRKYYHPQTVLV